MQFSGPFFVDNDNNSYINKINNYIGKHYFTLINVCKSIDENNPISNLMANGDCIQHVLSYLGSYKLLSEFLSCIELIGEEGSS